MLTGTKDSKFESILQRRELVIVLVLFFLSLLPRTVGLDLYYTVDEDTYLNRSYRFLQALMRGDWQGTFVNDATPGITTQWSGALGAWLYYSRPTSQTAAVPLGRDSLPEADRKSTTLLALTRYPIAILSALFVVAVYLMLRKSLSRSIALLAAFFLAFDPFFVSLSRVLGNDAPHAIFAVFAVLCLGLAWRTHARWWFAVSGASAGLAVLSKSPAFVLIPVVATVSFVWYAFQPENRRGWKWWVGTLAIWFGSMAVTIFAFWPSMWVQPLDTFTRILEIAAHNVVHANEDGSYFWGQPRRDPGPFYYPTAILLRTTPAVLVGALVAFVSAGSRLITLPKKALDSKTRWLLVLWAIPVFYLPILSLATRKSERLILPVFLALDILGAIGCMILLHWIATNWFKRGTFVVVGLGCTLLVVLQMFLCVSRHPYYFSYYEPLLGGARAARGVLPLGWGEGIEQAGRYLNAKENAGNLRVGIRWTSLLEKYFAGQTKGFPPRNTPQRFWPIELDYGIVYVSDLQRYGLPRTLKELYPTPEFVVNISGVDYASIYKFSKDKLKSLPSEATPLEAEYEDVLKLAGYRTYLPELDTVHNRYVLPMTLFWRVSRACPKSYRLALKIVNSAESAWGSGEIDPPCVGWQNTWRNDLILPDEIDLQIDPGTPPGAYDVEMRAPDDRQIAPIGKPVRLGPVEVPHHPTLTAKALDMSHVLNARLSDQAALLGYNLEGEIQAGRTLHLTLFWQALASIGNNYTVFVHVVGGQGNLLGQKDTEPVSGFYPTSHWGANEIIRDQYDVSLPSDFEDAGARLAIGMYLASTGERLPITLSDGAIPAHRAVTVSLSH